ncbi:hypothetical protein NLG97_g1518 [Lecanicillium saksenae]|uniref:Uncharacterized protein n=1 Tax=Lecanicillium saksenae TaxID=468837 RepID=A0ACC1R5F1_9HYPO|nr:hypothetical protein NLG97_g1518 [Lecanicillium saksenae]
MLQLFRRVHEMMLRRKRGISTAPSKRCVIERFDRIQCLSQNAVLTLLSKLDSFGAISFTYSANSYDQLRNEIPGAFHASALKVAFSGAGFRVEGCVVDDTGLAKLKMELNDELDHLLIERGCDIIHGGMVLNVQISVIREVLREPFCRVLVENAADNEAFAHFTIQLASQCAKYATEKLLGSIGPHKTVRLLDRLIGWCATFSALARRATDPGWHPFTQNNTTRKMGQ